MAKVNLPVSFNAEIEGTDIGYAKLGLEAQGMDPSTLKTHCLAIAKSAAEHEFKRLTAVGRSKRSQDLAVEVAAILADGLDNTLDK